MTGRVCVAMCMALLSGPGLTQAQNVRYVAADSYDVQIGEVARLTVQSSEKRIPLRWADAPVHWMFIRTGGTQENRQGATEDGRRRVSFDALIPGVNMVGVDFEPRMVEVGGKELAAFAAANLTEESRALLRTEHAAGGTIRRVESCKTLVRVHGPGEELAATDVGTGKSGQAFEIRPLFDPTGRLGDVLPVRVYVGGEKVAGARVFGTHLETGRRIEAVSNAKGIADLPFAGAGEWRIEFHDLRLIEADGEKGLTLYSGVLVFDHPEEGGEQ